MSESVSLRLTGELVFTPQKAGLEVNITLAHVEGKVAAVRKFHIPWQNTDFHNTVKFEVNRYMQEIGVSLGVKLCDRAPTSYLESARAPAAPPGIVGSGSPPIPLDNPVAPPVRRGRPPRASVAPPA